MKIIKVYREHLPAVRLIGKRYTDADKMDEGGYSHKWKEWLEEVTAQKLLGIKALRGYEEVMIGGMHCNENFEYWIGMFFPPETEAPEGMEYADLPKGDFGTCWIYGNNEAGELYGPEVHSRCIRRMKEEGMTPKEKGWCFERYHSHRFNDADEKGNVILDYCVYLEE